MDKILGKTKTLQFLSIDISLGSVVLCAFIGEIFDLRFSYAELSALALTVFIIYNFDHLVDGRKSQNLIISERRSFFIIHRVKIIGLLGISLMVLLLVLTYVQSKIIINGVILASLVLAYFLSVHMGVRKIYHKEISGALIYSLGIFLLPLSYLPSALSDSFLILFVRCFCLLF